MKQTIQTVTKIENYQRGKCEYCKDIPETSNATCYLNIRNIKNNKFVMGGRLCDRCEEKFRNDEFKTCSDCERVFKRGEETWSSCLCADEKSSDEEIESERYSVQLEKQINELNLDKQNLEVAVETSFDAIKVAENWDSRKELIEQNQDLEEKRRRLSNENKKLQTRIEDLETNLANKDGENTNLKSELSKLKLEILQLEEKIEGKESKIEIPPK